MKRILLTRTERGDLTDYALVGVGKIVLISEQMGREIVREEFDSVAVMMEETCFADSITDELLSQMVAYTTRLS